MAKVLTRENEKPEHLEPLAQAGALYDLERYDEARSLYEHLAERGSPEAAIAVACMHRDGNGVPRNADLARQWYEYALKVGSRLANHYLGDLNRTLGNSTEALQLFEASAQTGYAPSMYRAGAMLLKGDGVPRDLDAARRYLAAAAERDHVYARRDLALAELRGTFGQRRVLRGVVAWIRMAVFAIAVGWRYYPDDDRLL